MPLLRFWMSLWLELFLFKGKLMSSLFYEGFNNNFLLLIPFFDYPFSDFGLKLLTWLIGLFENLIS
jgi:hypothetical protein